MTRHRVARIEEPWTNFTPPIQGGTFNKCKASTDLNEKDGASSEKGLLSLSEASSLDVTQSGQYTADTIQGEIDADLAKYPSLDAATQTAITHKFRALHQRVQDEGYYDCRYLEYGKECVRYAALFALFVFFLRREWYFTSACFLGLFWHQIMFTAHDAGHRGITHNFVIDSLIGIFIGNFCSGLSIGWWKSSHNVHHYVTNDPVGLHSCCFLPSYSNSCSLTGPRPRHPERPSLLDFPSFLHLYSLILLQRLLLRLGCGRRHRGEVSTIHVLSGHGRCALQPLLLILEPSSLAAQHYPRHSILDTICGDC